MSLEGPLSKWTNMIHGWQFRWFVLDTTQGTFSYYTSKENKLKGECRGCIGLSQAYVGYDNEDDITFTITVEDKTFHLQARNLDEREKWVSRIEKSIRLHSAELATSNERKLNDIEAKLSDSELAHFDNNLTELDAYLQLLIEKLNTLEKRKECEKLSEEETENKNYDSLIDSTRNLIETLKHSIVCLQIAKANCDPVNGLHTKNELKQVLNNLHSNHSHQVNMDNIEVENKDVLNIKPGLSKVVRNDERKSLEKKENGNSRDDLSENGCRTAKAQSDQAEKTLTQPPLIRTKEHASYSSSDEEGTSGGCVAGAALKTNNISDYEDELEEEEDDDDEDYMYSHSNSNNDEDNESFYDAIDPTLISNYPLIEHPLFDPEQTTQTEPSVKKPDTNPTNNVQHSPDSKTSIELLKKAHEAAPDEEFKEEELDLNNQQSVITHLLSQVRIGMDLTKITLPTFILETRSLLEMYADFFAHTNLFLEIPDIQCPYERMIQVVKWYMSTFHAGRKSPVAKKPYNPILGEIFQCWYTPDSASKFDERIVEDGPVPWATRDQLTFISEQVSHHPPISAFYAEHFNKRIQLDGYTWTKSKFLGMHIGVHMIGKAVLSLLDLDEEYVMTFPSAYGRSILTVPWFEIGGQVGIACAKTGYSANITFLTKPFYGGKKHQIHGTIQGPDKKVLNTLEGDWTGTMFLKTGKKIEIFINTNALPEFRKQVRHLSEQGENESRRLWKDVTLNLRSKQIELATAAKQRIEQTQRDEEKARREARVKWQSRFFNEQGEHWIYVNPLSKRLLQQPKS